MQQKINTLQGKLLLLYPILFVVLATFIFWYLSTGQKSSDTPMSILGNFNLKAPVTTFAQAIPENKLSYYKEADPKKVFWNTLEDNDTALDWPIKKSGFSLSIPSEHTISKTPRVLGASDMAKKEKQLYSKLQQLQQSVGQKDPTQNGFPSASKNLKAAAAGPYVDIEQLQEMMIQVSDPNTKDPELRQLNELLESVLDIQQPRRVTRRLEVAQNNVTKAEFTPAVSSTPIPISFLGTKSTATMHYYNQERRFEVALRAQEKQRTHSNIKIVVHKDQDLTERSKVALSFDREITLEGTTIPEGKQMSVQLIDFNSRRPLVVKIKNKLLLNAKPL
ncbi:hypothetical protein [Galbibacter sp.]|uniref:hypothetical protein n=1 Tax=Galbibacter sp. TaxID=2918471 RepID=UPI003A8F71AE